MDPGADLSAAAVASGLTSGRRSRLFHAGRGPNAGPVGHFDADTGYFSEENTSYLEGERIDGHIATERLKHHEKIPLVPKGRPPKDLTTKQRMARKLCTKRGRETYAKPKGMIEPIFGQFKQARGFRQFLLRGRDQMRGEWRLVCMAHNLLKQFVSQQVAIA